MTDTLQHDSIEKVIAEIRAEAARVEKDDNKWPELAYHVPYRDLLDYADRLAALLAAPAAEPCAFRWRFKTRTNDWVYGTSPFRGDAYEVEALYAGAPPDHIAAERAYHLRVHADLRKAEVTLDATLAAVRAAVAELEKAGVTNTPARKAYEILRGVL